MKKTIISVLTATILLGGGSLASAEEKTTNNLTSPLITSQNSYQQLAGNWVVDTFNGPTNMFIAGNTPNDSTTAIQKFKLRSNATVSIKGWQETTANGKAPKVWYKLVDTETNRTIDTIEIPSEYKQHGTWYYRTFDNTKVTAGKNYRVDVVNKSEYGTRIGFDLYNNVYAN
ncbi:hypothetical protein BK739_10670 [Bacillus thuringiensis serovar pirenaica]|uniref:hypothetical protein n=1 Tax=Bacillus cereus TaxID=1396 RepID=UPI000A3A7ECC|nr:hypothetical protein BK739_10670 [Bacillus thuringiensis serovar pirenaica]HDR4873359.1 hypothetical protein [Bacillus cereus]